MNKTLYELRRRHGDTYLTKFLDGTEVPWKPLSLESFIKYDELFTQKRYPVSQIEDEIFTECCQDLSLIENIDYLEAGIVTTTVSQIMNMSGPVDGPGQIANDLNYARHEAGSFFSQGATLICQVFPGYTPEVVMSLDYRTYMIRLAMAELRLLELGIMQQPIEVLSQEGEAYQPVEVQKVQAPRSVPQNKLGNLNKQAGSTSLSSPLRTVGSQDVAANMEAYDPHERQDFLVTQYTERPQLLDGLEFIYPEYLDMINKGEQVTPEKIQEIKGKDFKGVENKHKEYVQKLKDGTIRPEVSEPAPPEPKKKKKIIVRRVQ